MENTENPAGSGVPEHVEKSAEGTLQESEASAPSGTSGGSGESGPLTASVIMEMLQEAERRGYKRGLDEREPPRKPSLMLWEDPNRTDEEERIDYGDTFLTALRPSVWD